MLLLFDFVLSKLMLLEILYICKVKVFVENSFGFFDKFNVDSVCCLINENLLFMVNLLFLFRFIVM